MNFKLELPSDLSNKPLQFEQHGAFQDSLSGRLFFSNGYGASIITRKPDEDSRSSRFSAQGSIEKGTFELGVIDEKKGFIVISDFIDDQEYSINNGIWGNLSKDDLLQKIRMISNLKRG
jgi:hypothetical protein